MTLSTVTLSTFGLRRDPPRPVAERQPGYEQLFDYDTLFYDVFHDAEHHQIICLGPPLLNCERVVSAAVFRLPDGQDIAWSYHPTRPTGGLHFQFRLALADGAPPDRVILELLGRRVEIVVQPSGRPIFANRRVVATLSKDNDLTWIRDWATFNIRVHGADAVLIYDNGSTSYELPQIADALAEIPGLDVVRVVSWRFPYGPNVGQRNIQDSFYCQPGCLEHMRWRFCGAARGVLNADIDELVVSRKGVSVFTQLEDSGAATLDIGGIWALKLDDIGRRQPDTDGAPVRHHDCLYNLREQMLLGSLRRVRSAKSLLRSKWVAAPGRCRDDVEWGVHHIYPTSKAAKSCLQAWRRWSYDLVYRHCQQVNTGWLYDRSSLPRYSFRRHVYDRQLARDLTVAFPRIEILPPTGISDGVFRWVIRSISRWLSSKSENRPAQDRKTAST